MAMETLSELLEGELKDIYSAEHQLLKALPRMAKKASSAELRAAFTTHVGETQEQITRLDEIGEQLGIKLTGKKCVAMEGLLEEGKEVLEEDGQESVIDLALIGAAQRVEHYEIAAYGTARAMAETLGHAKVVTLLQSTLDEESAADRKLTGIAQSEVLGAAKEADPAEVGEESEEA